MSVYRQYRSTMKPSTQSTRQLLSTLFALDERYSKRILVGLEYKHLIDRSSYKPVIRLTSSGFRGIAFTADCWEEFKRSFIQFSEFFFNPDMVVMERTLQRIQGTGWVAKLRKRSREIHIRSEQDGSTVTLKKHDFRCLVDAAKCIDDRIQYLQAIQKCVSDTIYEYYSLLTKDCELNHDGQITMYSRPLIEAANERIKDSVVSDIVNKIEINNAPFTANDLVIVLHEIVAFHIDEIIVSLNYEIMYLDYLATEEKEKSSTKNSESL